LLQTCFALGIMMVFLLFRIICRKTWIAAALLCLIMGFFGALAMISEDFGSNAAAFMLIFQMASMAITLFILLRFGLLALVASLIYNGLMLISPGTDFDTSGPFFGINLFVTLVAFAFAAYGWKTSLAGRPLFKDAILDD
jgi:hypothetical protein